MSSTYWVIMVLFVNRGDVMKRLGIWLLLGLSLTGCYGEKEATETSRLEGIGSEAGRVDELEQLRNENAKLTQQLEAQDAGLVNEEELQGNIRETMNLAFKLISAMENEDYAYMESVASSHVDILKAQNSIRFEDGEHKYETAFLKNVRPGDLEFRGYHQEEANRSVLMLARLYDEGYAELVFNYIRAEDGGWQWDGFLTN